MVHFTGEGSLRAEVHPQEGGLRHLKAALETCYPASGSMLSENSALLPQCSHVNGPLSTEHGSWKGLREAWVRKQEDFCRIASLGEADLLLLGDSITEGWRTGGGREAWANEFGASIQAIRAWASPCQAPDGRKLRKL